MSDERRLRQDPRPPVDTSCANIDWAPQDAGHPGNDMTQANRESTPLPTSESNYDG